MVIVETTSDTHCSLQPTEQNKDDIYIKRHQIDRIKQNFRSVGVVNFENME